jgi:hypothetical protein
MDETEAVKKALRKEHLKDIAERLGKKAALNPRIEDMPKDDDEIRDMCNEVLRRYSPNSQYSLVGLIRILASELADTKAELWSQKHLRQDQ